MRIAISVVLLMVSASGANAQRRGAFVANPPYAGRPALPAVDGTPGAVVWNPGSPRAPSCCTGADQRLGWREHSREERNPAIVAVPVPVAIPVPIAGDADAQALGAESEGANQLPPEPPPPPVVAPFPRAPETAEPRGIALADQPPEPPYVLIALENGWVYAATDYWLEGRTLHYITTDGIHNQASLDFVDRETSARLNQASQIEFALPR